VELFVARAGVVVTVRVVVWGLVVGTGVVVEDVLGTGVVVVDVATVHLFLHATQQDAHTSS